MSVKTLPILIIILFLCNPVDAQKISVGLVRENISQQEFAAIRKMFENSGRILLKEISLNDIANNSFNNIKALWLHRTDTTDLTQQEIGLSKNIKNFVSNGGNLFLSMEAFPLLNVWEIESVATGLQVDTVIDEGFGRPLGFHGFKDHAIFKGLLGGVYTSKQTKDHIVRKHGFFADAVPANGKTIGIQWTYIRFWEEDKLLLEYDLGKGKIIAAGAYMYYSAENYQKMHIKKFTENVFDYTSGRFKNSQNHYWDYTKPKVEQYNFDVAPLATIKASKWNLPKPTLELTQNKSGNNFYDLVGRKILWMGRMNSGVEEIWMHPFMALRDFEAGIRFKNEDTVRWLKNIIPSTTVSPEFLVREYLIGKSHIKEVQTVSFDKPLGIVHFEIGGNEIEELVVTYSSNLRYMWPYNNTATESVKYQFNEGINGHIFSGQKGALNTVVLYSLVPVKQSISPTNEQIQVDVSNTFKIADNAFVNIYIAGSTSNVHDAISNFTTEKNTTSSLFVKSNKYYKNILKNYLIFETPDSVFNEGFKWALARTDQFLQTSPGIGTSLMAGFGTTARGWNGRHQISGRPGYAWYFGRDAEWSAMAINAYGDFKMVKEVLRSFVRYQDLNGKIYHELTSSGVAHYDAADATPLFIILAAHYLKYSGDSALIKELWHAIKKAYDYCKSTDTDGDGLIENTNVGHGWIEGGPLFGTHSEFYLVGCWAATLEAMAYLSSHLDRKQDAANYSSESKKVKQIIDKQFWNEQQSFFHVGKMKDGSFMPYVTGYSVVPVYLNSVTDKGKIFKMNERLASKYFSTDWGLRMLEDSSSKYHPGSYHSGMVWPLYSGWAALSQFKTGHNTAGFKNIMNNLLVYKDWALGSVEETLNGSSYKPNGVCHHQCWSETMVLQPAVEGMLGLESDAMKNLISLSPYFPWQWRSTTVKNIRGGLTTVHLDLKRTENSTNYTLKSTKEADCIFEPKFPSSTEIKNVFYNGKSIRFAKEVLAEGIKIKTAFRLKSGTNIFNVEHSGGIGFIPSCNKPNPGDSSVGINLIAEKLSGTNYSLLLQGLPSVKYEIMILTFKKPFSISGAVLKSYTDNILTLEVLPVEPVGHLKYANINISLSF